MPNHHRNNEFYPNHNEYYLNHLTHYCSANSTIMCPYLAIVFDYSLTTKLSIMKKIMQVPMLIIALFLSLQTGLKAQQNDKTLSPYFKIISENGNEELPLKSTTADVKIAGVIADVTIDQVYENTGESVIEAIYVFPSSTRAAVYDMEMKVGEKVIQAVVKEKQKAKQDYQKAKQNGQRASLLEQNRPNVFTMNVANILPGDKITVSLKYTETMIPESGVYSFVYPTVVGPRYNGENKSTGENQLVPYTKNGEMPLYQFDIKATISAGMTIQDVRCRTHKTNISFNGLNEAIVSLNTADQQNGNRDFILEYELAGKEIKSGLMLYEGAEENHFMLTVQPPKKVLDKDIPQREYIFVVDVSGSMNGFPLDITKKLMRNLLGNLRYDDMFNVVLFASASQLFSTESAYATPENIEDAIEVMTKRQGGGGTNMLSALERTVNLPKCENGLSRSIIVVTDGYVSVETEVYDLIRKSNNEFNFFSFGIGSSVNRSIIEGIAHVGNGEPLFITDQTQANVQAEKFRQLIASPVLTDIAIDWGEFDVYDLEPSHISDVLGERPVVISGKYRGRPSGEIQLTGVSGREDYTAIYNTANAIADKNNKALSYLWARKRIQLLDDYIKLDKNDFKVAEVTNLGLKYNLLTNYTSFIAIEAIQALARNTPSTTVTQPLPLPHGVPNTAIGNSNAVAYAGNTSNNYGVGADLKITNTTAMVRHADINEVEGDFSSIEIKFLDMQLQKQVATLKSVFKKDMIKGVEIELVIDENGNIENVMILNRSPLSYLKLQSIVKNIYGWNFKIKQPTTLKITLI